MKKILIFAVMLLMPLFVKAETVIKTGTVVTCGKIEEASFTFLSVELKFEQSLLYKGLSIGLGIRKETNWGYGGYYCSLYPTYKMELPHGWFIAAGFGVEYGLDTKYNYYSRKYQAGNLVSQKWIHIIQNAPLIGDAVKGDTGILYCFSTFSFGTKVWKGVSIEAGIKMQALRFASESCSFDPRTQKAYDMVEKRMWAIMYSFQASVGYRLF